MQEISALEQKGYNIQLFALHHPRKRKRHHFHVLLEKPIIYLIENFIYEPISLIKALIFYKKNKKLNSIWPIIQEDIIKTKSLSPLKLFFQTLIFLKNCPRTTTHIHAHCISEPSDIAYYAHLISGKNFSIAAHTKDVWTTPSWNMKRKIEKAEWITVCNKESKKHLLELSLIPNKIHLIHHGIDLKRFPLRKPKLSTRNGQSPDDPVRIIALGRLVPKKGFSILLKALALLPKELHWKLTLGGGGIESNLLKETVMKLALQDKVSLLGPLSAHEVRHLYDEGDLFVLPSRVTEDGDRDGLPSVLLEAISAGVSIVSTYTGGIPELIQDQENGFLIEPNQIEALMFGIKHLLQNPNLRYEFSKKAQEKLLEHFDLETGIEKLDVLFRNYPILRAA